MAFTRSNVNFAFQQPNLDPNLVQQAPDFGGGIESLFNNYLKMKQNQRADQMAPGQLLAQKQQTDLGAQQLAQGQRQAGMANLQETAQFGAPIASFSPEETMRAQAGITQGPGDQAGQDRLRKFAEGLHAIGEKTRMASQEQQAGLAETGAKTDKLKAEAEKLRGESGQTGAKAGMKAEDELRGELQTLSKPFVQVRDSMGRIEAAARNPSAAGDLALIFNYMKVLDPGSTVREGEFATAQNSAGMPERIRAKYNQVVNGERLEETQRADFMDRARDLYKSQENIQKHTEGQYRELAGRRGANPQNVILNQGLPASAPPSGKIRVSNGKETLLIDAADEAAASKDGYARAK